MTYKFITPILLFLLSNQSLAVDWYSCESELTRVSRQARSAGSVASDIQSIKSSLDSLKNDYENCLNYPEIYDLMQDGCESRRNNYNWKVEEYNSRVSSMDDEINNLTRRMKNSLNHCGYQ
ncbi:hypothetical protein [Neptunomonas japonica]|uniref:hypothetical protein n=1 Tax=Neptunomonas japonica TaxID=417574 RepID=UPI00048C43E9|nr:hypothetical protein [Neptunomonas japonica]